MTDAVLRLIEQRLHVVADMTEPGRRFSGASIISALSRVWKRRRRTQTGDLQSLHSMLPARFEIARPG